MQKVAYIQKDKQISGAGANYKAVTHDQVTSIVRPLFVEVGIVIYPEQLTSSMPIMRDVEKQIKMHLYEGSYSIHFVNIDKPDDRITVKIFAQANDNGDKAPGKAATYATKTAILKVLCLETGENEESREVEREASKAIDDHAVSFLGAAIDGDPRLWKSLCSAYGINHLNQIPKSKESEVTKRIHDYNAKKKEKVNADNS